MTAGRFPAKCSCGGTVNDPVTARGDARDGTPIGAVRCFDRNYEANGAIGSTPSTVPAGGWQRGQIVRQAQPMVRLAWYGPMYDPTDPATWRPGP